MALTGRIATRFNLLITAARDLDTAKLDPQLNYQHDWADGAGASQAQLFFSDRRTVAFGVTDSIDLAGSLTSPLGGTLTFAAIKELFVKAADTNVGDLVVGKAISNVWVGPFGASATGVKVPPGGILHLRNPSAAGWTVTAGTGDLLPVENLAGSGTASYDILLIGK